MFDLPVDSSCDFENKSMLPDGCGLLSNCTNVSFSISVISGGVGGGAVSFYRKLSLHPDYSLEETSLASSQTRFQNYWTKVQKNLNSVAFHRQTNCNSFGLN